MAYPKIGSIGPDNLPVKGHAAPDLKPGQVIIETGPDGHVIERYVTTAETLGRVGSSSLSPDGDAPQEQIIESASPIDKPIPPTEV